MNDAYMLIPVFLIANTRNCQIQIWKTHLGLANTPSILTKIVATVGGLGFQGMKAKAHVSLMPRLVVCDESVVCGKCRQNSIVCTSEKNNVFWSNIHIQFNTMYNLPKKGQPS